MELGAVKACFNTQPPEGGWYPNKYQLWRPKCFNTQPPEGGWVGLEPCASSSPSFNTQPPEGGWAKKILSKNNDYLVSTHSRPKAAGLKVLSQCLNGTSFNTQPPEGGWPINSQAMSSLAVSTHSRPKAAGMAFVGILI